MLTLTANNASVVHGEALPALTFNTAGWVNGDATNVLSGLPALTSNAKVGSPVGSYPITITQGTLTSGNYGFKFVNGTLTIVAIGVAATPVFKPAAGNYTSVQSVTITDATPGAIIHSTANRKTPTAASAKYTKAVAVSTSETVKAIAGATGYSQSAVASATYTITLPAATPVFSPAAGTYPPARTVKITDATAGSTISYTTNGNTPTTASAKYTGAITVSATETVKAIAVAPNHSQSVVATATYTIK